LIRLVPQTILSHPRLLTCPSLSPDPVTNLESWLTASPLSDARLNELTTQDFAKQPLTAEQADRAGQILWRARTEFLRADRKAEVEARELVIGDLKMPFWYRTFGDQPA
ncbi:MAG: hypothetical protein ACKON9_21865, partial [Planctomycetaceae bacterium]